jgi:osmoprotectant transport system permease protein
VTVTALVGAGGYGAFITDGLSRRFSTPIVVGTTLSVTLAVVLDVALVIVERLLTPWARRGVAVR